MNEISTRHSTTPIQINDSNTLTIHSGNERQDLCLNRNSLCLLSQEDLILTSLQKLHYIDEKGWIQKDQKIIKAPIYLTPEQVEKIKQSYLAKVFNLVDTLWSMLENHPDDQLFLIGSTVKTLIPKILADYIQALNTLDPLFPPFCFKDQQSRDIDFRFYLPHCDYEFLRAFCLKAEEFLNASGVGQIKVTLPLYIPTDIFASITFIINGLKVDLTFVQKASRLHLFVLDALQLLLKQGTQDDLYLLVSD